MQVTKNQENYPFLLYGIQGRSERLFELILVFRGGFGMRYIRVFCKFPE